MSKNQVPLGVFSNETLRDADVGDALANLLRPLRLTRIHRACVRDWDRYRASGDYDADPDAQTGNVLDLWDALDHYLPPYTYAGASEGDGACFGVWPCDPAELELPRYPAGESPRGSEDCLEVSDHGNVACGRRLTNGRWIEYWSVV